MGGLNNCGENFAVCPQLHWTWQQTTFSHDGEFAEPPRVTSLQNSEPNPTFTDFGENMLFVADQRGFERVVHYVARQFLKRDNNGTIMDPRLLLNKVKISYHHNIAQTS